MNIQEFAKNVEEGHGLTLSGYIRRLCRNLDDRKFIDRCYEYDRHFFDRAVDRFDSLPELGKRTFGPNNIGISFLNLQVSSAFQLYHLYVDQYADPKTALVGLDEEFKNSQAYKAAVSFERGHGSTWIRDVFGFVWVWEERNNEKD